YKCSAEACGICVIGERKEKEYVFAYLDPVRGKGAEIARIHAEILPFWDLSPDASKLLVLPLNSSSEVTTISLADGKAKSIKLKDPEWLIQNACWSADSSHLYATAMSREQKFALLAVDGNGEIKATEQSVVGWFNRPSCSPDARVFAFNQELFRQDLLLL